MATPTPGISEAAWADLWTLIDHALATGPQPGAQPVTHPAAVELVEALYACEQRRLGSPKTAATGAEPVAARS